MSIQPCSRNYTRAASQTPRKTSKISLKIGIIQFIAIQDIEDFN